MEKGGTLNIILCGIISTFRLHSFPLLIKKKGGTYCSELSFQYSFEIIQHRSIHHRDSVGEHTV